MASSGLFCFSLFLNYSKFTFIYIIAVLLCASIIGTEGKRHFFRGRMRGGNLNVPNLLSSSKLPPDEWFTQDLDHFDPQNNGTWKQRFFRNTEYYKPGGPIFLMIGGEGEASPKWMVQGMWIEYAKQHSALCFQLEHRFYGQSRPTPDLSVESLQYLTSEQALADLAAFIEQQKKELPEGGKWVVFGGSYPGSLAAWSRARYPHLIHAAVSASGPLLALADFQDYYKVVEEALASTKDGCVEAVANATSQLKLMLSHRIGQRTVSKMFNLCESIEANPPIDLQNFYETIGSDFAGIVQYNKDNRIGGSGSNTSVDTICEIMMGQSGVAVRKLATLSNLLLEEANETCLNHTYKSTVDPLKNSSWNSEESEGGRQWTYQTCTEFGFFQTSTRPESQRLFGDFPLSLFEKQCQDIFGDQFSVKLLDKGVERSNTEYGALNYKTDRVVFVHGSIDPWHALGIIQSRGSKTPAIYIRGTAHCANMYPPSPDDLPQLVEARRMISKYIGQWLQES